MSNHQNLLSGISVPHLISALLIPDAIDFALKPAQIIFVTFVVLVDCPF